MYLPGFLFLAGLQLIAAQDLSIPNLSGVTLEDHLYRGGKMYAVAAFAKVNWFNAQHICSYRGMTLASVSSASENEGLKRYLADKGLTNERFWLSGTDLAAQGDWFWLSNGSPITFERWAVGEPNNDGGVEHCLALLSNGRWNDASCDTPMYFICENRCPLDSYSVPLFKKK